MQDQLHVRISKEAKEKLKKLSTQNLGQTLEKAIDLLEEAEMNTILTSDRFAVTYFLTPDGIQPWVNAGAGRPKAEKEGKWVEIFTIPQRAVPETVLETLRELEPILQKMRDQYKKTGKWSDLSYRRFEFPSFYSPEDWWEDQSELKEKFAKGMTPKEILETEFLGSKYQSRVDYDEALEWLTIKCQEWAEEAAN